MKKPESFEVESPILQIVLERFLAAPDADFVVTRTLRPYVEFCGSGASDGDMLPGKPPRARTKGRALRRED